MAKDEEKSPATAAKASQPRTVSTPTIDKVAESNDPAVNPQSQRPGDVQPGRTPGSAPSVTPLPSGAAPGAQIGEHPLPEDVIDGYPPATKMQAEADEAAAADALGK